MALRTRRRNSLYAGTACPRCSVPLRHETLTSGTQVCPRCGKQFDAVHFLPVEPLAAVAEIAGLDPSAGAPCAKHARNKAEAACQRCGQFMCALCKIDADGKAFCPACFERLSGEGALQSTATKLKNYSGMAAFFALINLFLCWLVIGLVTAPVGILYAVRGLGQKKKMQETEGIVGLYLSIVFNALLFVASGIISAAYFGAFR